MLHRYKLIPIRNSNKISYRLILFLRKFLYKTLTLLNTAENYVSYMIANLFAKGNMKTLPIETLPRDDIHRAFEGTLMMCNSFE